MIVTMRPVCDTPGIGLKSVELIQLAIVLFAPMPNASVSTAVSVNHGARRNWRSA
jgi:hypothetical protein